DRVAECAADFDAGNSRLLLRGRDRHGRQYLSARSRRRAYANAMVVRSQWRVFPNGSGASLPAADYGSRLRVRSRQCRGAEPFAIIVAELDKAADRRPALAARVRTRHAAVSLPVEP